MCIRDQNNQTKPTNTQQRRPGYFPYRLAELLDERQRLALQAVLEATALAGADEVLELHSGEWGEASKEKPRERK